MDPRRWSAWVAAVFAVLSLLMFLARGTAPREAPTVATPAQPPQPPPGDATPTAPARPPPALPSAGRQAAAPTTPRFEDEARALWRLGGEALLKLYERGLASERPEDRFLALRAWDLCFPVVIGAVPLKSGDRPTEAQRRYDDTFRLHGQHCAPFHRHRREHFMADGQRLRQSLKAADSPFRDLGRLPIADGAGVEARDSAEMRAYGKSLRRDLERYGTTALLWRDAELADWLRLSAMKPGETWSPLGGPYAPYTATLLALCHAGFDCSRSSNLYFIVCGQTGHCGRDLAESLRDMEAGDAGARIDQQARRIARAVERRDYGALGW